MARAQTVRCSPSAGNAVEVGVGRGDNAECPVVIEGALRARRDLCIDEILERTSGGTVSLDRRGLGPCRHAELTVLSLPSAGGQRNLSPRRDVHRSCTAASGDQECAVNHSYRSAAHVAVESSKRPASYYVQCSYRGPRNVVRDRFVLVQGADRLTWALPNSVVSLVRATARSASKWCAQRSPNDISAMLSPRAERGVMAVRGSRKGQSRTRRPALPRECWRRVELSSMEFVVL
jgi:hypothetical protein